MEEEEGVFRCEGWFARGWVVAVCSEVRKQLVSEDGIYVNASFTHKTNSSNNTSIELMRTTVKLQQSGRGRLLQALSYVGKKKKIKRGRGRKRG